MRGSVYWYRLLNMQQFDVMNDFNCNRDAMIALYKKILQTAVLAVSSLVYI